MKRPIPDAYTPKHLAERILTSRSALEGERRQVHDYYRQALALATELGMRPLVAHCHLGLDRLYCRKGKRAEAHKHLSTATTMYREMEMRFWLEQAEVEIRTLKEG